jgi:hypothetical protein
MHPESGHWRARSECYVRLGIAELRKHWPELGGCSGPSAPTALPPYVFWGER